MIRSSACLRFASVACGYHGFSRAVLPNVFRFSPLASRRFCSMYYKKGESMKAQKIGVALLVLGATFYCFKSADKEKPNSLIFLAVTGIKWVEKCVEKHPEILWLADTHVRKTEEGQATLQGSYSEQLFGKKFVEFDRTLMTLHCLKLILDGSDKAYNEFVSGQASEFRLTKESFQVLHLQGKKILKSQLGGMSETEIAQAMETALVLGDIGKSEKAREVFKTYGIQAPDHDDFYGEAMQILKDHPDLCPSFQKLNSPSKELLVKVANLAHYGHITHLEGTSAMFSRLKQSNVPSSDPMALSFDLFVHTCDVAGALGHVNNKSSIVYTEQTHKAMQAMSEAVFVLSDVQKTKQDAYESYLSQRACWLGLNNKDKTDRVLARIGAMLRLFTPEDGAILRNAIAKLETGDREKIIAQLDVNKDIEEIRTPTYMPAVLVNLLNNNKLGATKEERLKSAVVLGLPFISKVLEKHKDLLSHHEIDKSIPLNFNRIAGIAKEAPTQLLFGEITIDKDGNVDAYLKGNL